MPESNYEYALLSQYPFVDVDVSMVKNDHVWYFYAPYCANTFYTSSWHCDSFTFII
jgi:hypothetical protein